jgi:gluconate 5-dehydrogenase
MALAEAGARVMIASRSVDKCQALAAKLIESGHQAAATHCDITDEASIRAAVDATAEQFGRLDILVNNAYGGPAPTIADATADDFQSALMAGVTAYFVAAQQAAGHMRTAGGGSIINIASMYGMVASYPEVYVDQPFNSPPNYHAVKGGVIHLTRHLGVYWAADKIRVNAISPGAFPPPRVEDNAPVMVERIVERIPMHRIGQPDEIKGAALFLASQASSYVTGQNIVVDGGWTSW